MRNKYLIVLLMTLFQFASANANYTYIDLSSDPQIHVTRLNNGDPRKTYRVVDHRGGQIIDVVTDEIYDDLERKMPKNQGYADTLDDWDPYYDY